MVDDRDRADLLRVVPATYAMPAADKISKLPRGTGPKDQQHKGSCSECGGFHVQPSIHLDYEGHADVTLDLIAVDPLWTWEPAGVDDTGAPVWTVRAVNRGQVAVMWGSLTVHGVTRRCVGTCELEKDELEKELIGDLLRNGAMRFGIGTKLWSKADRESAKHDEDRGGSTSPPRQSRSRPRQSRASSTDEGAAEAPKAGGVTRKGDAPEYVRAIMDEFARSKGAMVVEARKIMGDSVTDVSQITPEAAEQIRAKLAAAHAAAGS